MSFSIRTAVSFDQLSEDQQHEVLDRFREINVEDEFWYEFLVEDFKEELSGKGFSCENIHFDLCHNLFSFDAELTDYAAFLSGMELTEKEKRVAAYMFENDFIRLSYDTDNYTRICLDFNATNPHSDYVRGSFDVKTWFFNVDENCKQAEAYLFCHELLNKIEWHAEDFGNETCHKMLKRLEEEYEYQTSDEVIKDTILANEYQFDFETAEML